MSAYAIMKSGNKQYRVAQGDIIDVDLLEVDAKAPFECGEILIYCDGKKTLVGAPTVAKAFIKGEVLAQVRGPKVIAYKYKKRKNYRRKVGHRQNYTRVKILELGVK